MSKMNDLALVVLGWLLGLLSLPLGDGIRRAYRRKELGRSIWLELNELRHKLVTVAWHVRSTQGTLDLHFHDWVRKHMEGYRGVLSETPFTARLRADISAARIEELNARSREPREDIAFIKYSTPFLATHLDALGIFPLDVQRRLSEILMRLDTFNQTVERLDANFARTFDRSLTPGDRAAVNANTELWWSGAATHAVLLVEHVDELESSLAT